MAYRVEKLPFGVLGSLQEIEGNAEDQYTLTTPFVSITDISTTKWFKKMIRCNERITDA